MYLNLKKTILLILLLISLAFAPLIITAQSENNSIYITRFLELWNDIHDPANGYFSPDGAPYYSIERLMVEIPDYGHESMSITYSYWLWLEAMYGRITGDWTYLRSAWETLENHIIPAHELQPTNFAYDPSNPSTSSGGYDNLPDYPVILDNSIPTGQDPIAAELALTYETPDIYSMHWLLDSDNFYGFGIGGNSAGTPSYIDTYKRGKNESCWETIPHPCWDDFTWGGIYGFIPLFYTSYSRIRPRPQWEYSILSDADARAVQAVYWASIWAEEQGLDPVLTVPVEKAVKMGDYLRYSFFDKYFKPIGTQTSTIQAYSRKYTNLHYLLSWYFEWGGTIDTSSAKAWRKGCSDIHYGYQNPVTAWALSTSEIFCPASPNGQRDWEVSFKRQIEFYKWLQTDEGAIAGGATSSWNGQYEAYPAGHPVFYGLGYVENPEYADLSINKWFGMQVRSMERMCEMYYLTENELIDEVVEKWIAWIKTIIIFNADGTYYIPGELECNGLPDTWDPDNPGSNSNFHITVTSYTQDVGLAGCLAKALTYYAAGTQKRGNPDADAQLCAKELLDSIWNNFRDEIGIAIGEEKPDYYNFFLEDVYVPYGYYGVMPNGDVIEPGISFIDIRRNYCNVPEYSDLVAAFISGQNYEESYHRFSAQAEIAMALAEYGAFFYSTK